MWAEKIDGILTKSYTRSVLFLNVKIIVYVREFNQDVIFKYFNPQQNTTCLFVCHSSACRCLWIRVVIDLRNAFNVFLCRGQYFKYNVAINSKISLDNFEVSIIY